MRNLPMWYSFNPVSLLSMVSRISRRLFQSIYFIIGPFLCQDGNNNYYSQFIHSTCIDTHPEVLISSALTSLMGRGIQRGPDRKTSNKLKSLPLQISSSPTLFFIRIDWIRTSRVNFEKKIKSILRITLRLRIRFWKEHNFVCWNS